MRRLRQDLVFMYKVIFDLVSDSCNELFKMFNSSISTRDHACKLFQSHSRLDSRKHLIALWNSLLANNYTLKIFATFKLFQKTYQFIKVVNGVSHSHKTANIIFSFDSVT